LDGASRGSCRAIENGEQEGAHSGCDDDHQQAHLGEGVQQAAQEQRAQHDPHEHGHFVEGDGARALVADEFISQQGFEGVAGKVPAKPIGDEGQNQHADDQHTEGSRLHQCQGGAQPRHAGQQGAEQDQGSRRSPQIG
jgi:hypothetical protein